MSKPANEKSPPAGKNQKRIAHKAKSLESADEAPAVLESGFKIDQSPAVRSLSDAYAMTRKRLYGGK